MPAGVDLRSDTVTQPTPAMRRAMADAVVGDDVYGEDPTVRALEEAFAERIGMEASLFVPSGVMGNQAALRLHTRPGDVVLIGRGQHILAFENGAAACNAGVQFYAVDDEDGTFDAAEVDRAVALGRHHQPAPALVCVENTHMRAGGAPWPIDRLEAVAEAAGRAGLPVHLDGARLFNAEVSTGTAAASYAACATTVMCCLSKALCAPVGSMLAGSAAVVAQARVERHRLGGAMRQAGVLAAAGLVALGMVDRLADDHSRARRLAEVVADRWPGAGLDPGRVRTNIVAFAPPDAEAVLAHLADRGVLAGTVAPGVIRLVTHRDVDDAGLAMAEQALRTAP